MPTTNNLPSEEPVNCPFLAQPCPQGNAQGIQCQFRVAQDFDPLHRLHDFEIIYCAESVMKHLTAKDVMNPRVISVPASWTIDELGQFLVDKAITGAPVTDESGTFIGVVSLTDIVRQESMSELQMRADDSAPHQKAMEAERGRGPHDYYLHGWENRLAVEEISSFHIEARKQIIVREIMTPMIFKVDESTSIREVADTMIDGRIHRLLVTRGGKIVGIVTTMDLLKVIRDM